MGRRAVRKLKNVPELAKWLLEPTALPRPWSASDIFGRAAPLEVEVGSGKGLFLLSAAPAAPQHDFLGIEVAAKYATFAAARLAKADVPNAVVVHGDAQAIFREVLPPCSVAAVHVYFPDPWWKARHRKRRILNEAFLAAVERALIAGGALHFWTDVEEYHQSTLAIIPQATRLEGPLPVAEIPAAHDLDYRTHFERRMRQSNLPVYRAQFRKPDVASGVS